METIFWLNLVKSHEISRDEGNGDDTEGLEMTEEATALHKAY